MGVSALAARLFEIQVSLMRRLAEASRDSRSLRACISRSRPSSRFISTPRLGCGRRTSPIAARRPG